MMQLCFATNNAHKLEEIRHKLGDRFDIMSLNDIGFLGELPETSNTIEGNSLQKADFVFRKFDIDCIADDTGLEVDALDGAPGVISARYAGPGQNASENIDLLLKNMEGRANRSARFKTVITLLLRGKKSQFEGVVQGAITHERRGSDGFGYDPVFVPEGHRRTFAEMSMDEKNQISHRSRAVEQLVKYLTGDQS